MVDAVSHGNTVVSVVAVWSLRAHCVVISADCRELTDRAGDGRLCRLGGPGQMTDRRQDYLISLQTGVW